MSIFDHIKFGDNLQVTDEGSGVIRVDGYGAQGPQGPTGPTGPTGPVGPAGASGVIPGGTRGQALTKQSSTDGDSVWSPRVSFPPDGAGGDIVLGGDTNLLRMGASALKTDSFLVAGGGVNIDYSNSGGRLYFGSAADTSVYRAAAGVVKTDGMLSTQNERGYVEGTSQLTLAVGVWTTLLTLGPITFDGSTIIMLEYWCPFVNHPDYAGLAGITLGLFDNGGQVGASLLQRLPGAGAPVLWAPAPCQRRYTPTAGSHTFVAQAYVDQAGTSYNATVGAGAGSGGYSPMYLRAIRVN